MGEGYEGESRIGKRRYGESRKGGMCTGGGDWEVRKNGRELGRVGGEKGHVGEMVGRGNVESRRRRRRGGFIRCGVVSVGIKQNSVQIE